MRKALLLLAMAGAAWLWGMDSVQAEALESTDSGAPSAIVIFPVGEKPNPRAAAMPPVAFNHLIHEKWAAKNNKDCLVCHHTGDAVACTECHTVQGSEKANFVNLEKAMHAEFIAKRKENTPSSCVSCHIEQTKQRECAGCHGHLVRNARRTDSWCKTCHTISPNMTQAQLKQGIEGKLPEARNEAIAAETALARKPVKYWPAMSGPYKVAINTLENKYEPSIFNHKHHVQTLMDRIAANKLAGAFHSQQGTVCVTCHHNSPASLTPPKCSSCHSALLDWEQPARPKLMAAFHLQCMSCHTDMKVARPRNTDCDTCHKPRQSASQ